MCLLIVKPEGVLIQDVAKLCHSATEANPDGFGLATIGKRGIITRKGLWNPSSQIQEIEAIGTAPAIIHWRWGTSGGTTIANCHPFRIRDGSVFAHNGVLPINPLPGLSDTRTVAESVETHAELVSLLSDHVGRGNKFATIRRSGEIQILGEEFGTWKNGIWLSNLNHEWDYRSEHESASDVESILLDLVEEYGFDSIREILDQIERQKEQSDDWPCFWK